MHYPFLSILLRRRIQLNVPRSKVNAPPWSIEKLSKNCPKCRWQMRTNRPPPQSGGGALLERKRAASFRGVSFLQFLYSIYRQRCTSIFHDYARSSFRLPEENSFSSLDRLVIVSTGQEGTGMRADKLNYLRNLSLLFPSSILPSLLLTIIIKGCCVRKLESIWKLESLRDIELIANQTLSRLLTFW